MDKKHPADESSAVAARRFREQRDRLRRRTRAYLKFLRERAVQENAHPAKAARVKEIVFSDPRKGHLGGRYVDRLVLFLRGSGCSLAAKTGGCTFCGFWDVTTFGRKITDEDYLSQVDNVIANERIGFSRYPIICLYNDGSMLEEGEISLSAVTKLCRTLAARDHVQRIVIEAKVVDITESKIAALRKAVGSKEFEIAVGFESANDLVRDHCINKPFRHEQFETGCRLLGSYGMSLIPLVMVKPSFLTETQAIEDVVNTFAYLEPFHLQRIDLELATIEKNTLVHELWACGMYQTPRLWSVIEILRRKEELGLKTPIFLSPPNYTVTAYEYSLNCPKCNDQVIAAIEVYNRTGDFGVFSSLSCSCRAEWLKTLEADPPATNLLDQIEMMLDRLGVPQDSGETEQDGTTLEGAVTGAPHAGKKEGGR